jgi:hypothetical protein
LPRPTAQCSPVDAGSDGIRDHRSDARRPPTAFDSKDADQNDQRSDHRRRRQRRSKEGPLITAGRHGRGGRRLSA